jgi:hypothetical protein
MRGFRELALPLWTVFPFPPGIILDISAYVFDIPYLAVLTVANPSVDLHIYTVIFSCMDIYTLIASEHVHEHLKVGCCMGYSYGKQSCMPLNTMAKQKLW